MMTKVKKSCGSCDTKFLEFRGKRTFNIHIFIDA